MNEKTATSPGDSLHLRGAISAPRPGRPDRGSGHDHFVRSVEGPQAPLPRRSTDVTRRWDAFRRELDEQIDFYKQYNVRLAGRMKLIRYVIDAFKQPKERWPETVRALREDHAAMVEALLARMTSVPATAHRMTIALARYEEAAEIARRAIDLLTKSEGMTGPDAAHLISGELLTELRRKLYLVTTYDLLFKEDPVLSQMFPLEHREVTRTGQKSTAIVPRDPEKPAAPAPKTLQTMPMPPPVVMERVDQLKDSLLGKVRGVVKDAVERIKSTEL